MPRRPPARPADSVAAALVGLLILLLTLPALAGDAPADRQQLQLEVTIKGHASNLIVPFVRTADGKLATTRSELEELHIKAPGTGAPKDLVRLDSIPGLTFTYDEPGQKLDIVVGDDHRQARRYDVRASAPTRPVSPGAWGGVLNYSLFASASQDIATWDTPAFSGANVSLDGRFTTPHGVLTQTAILGSLPGREATALRLESAFTHADEASLTTYRAGDTISGGLNWTRPIRMAGLQAQRSFTLRPDLLSVSLPSFSGSAAVPSTVDVYVNNIKMHSQQVGAGPFELANLPFISGGGTARMVVRDAAGKEVETTLPFYTSPRLVKEGLTDFSVEAGAPRLRFGTLSDEYEETLVGSGSLRHGITDWLTGETHAEGGAGLVNGGLGLVVKAGELAVVNAAVSGSLRGSHHGAQAFGGAETKIGIVSISGRTQRALGGYEDLATLTARLRPTILPTAGSGGYLGYYSSKLAQGPARSVDSVTVSVPIAFDKSTVSATFLHIVPDLSTPSRIVNISYSRPLLAKATLFATAFRDLDDSKTAGLFVGVSMPLGDNLSAGASLARTANGTTVGVDATKSMDQDVGSWGWRVRDAEGDQASRSAAVSHRASFARVEGAVRQEGKGIRGTLQADGAVVAMGGDVFAANTVDDSFAVVSAGAPGVRVLHENRYVGDTNTNGRLLIPGLRSYQTNKVAIDPSNLPVDADVGATHQMVTPGLRSGVYVDFKVQTEVAAALITLKTADGADVPAGTEGKLDGGPETFVVGYDGQAYVKGLNARNIATLTLAKGPCRAEFAFQAVKGTQTAIGPVVCQ